MKLTRVGRKQLLQLLKNGAQLRYLQLSSRWVITVDDEDKHFITYDLAWKLLDEHTIKKAGYGFMYEIYSLSDNA